MFQLIPQIIRLLNHKQKKQLIALQLLVILMALIEVLAIAAIAPFMLLVAAPEKIADAGVFNYFAQTLNPTQIAFYTGLAVLTLLVFAGLLSMYTTWRLAKFAADTGAEISDRLFSYYLSQNWLYHTQHTSNQLTKQIATDAIRVSDLVIQPILLMNARITLVAFISVMLFIYNPVITLFGLVFFLLLYGLIYRQAKNRLHQSGQRISDVATARFQILSEGFGGIKEILLNNRQRHFTQRLKKTGQDYAQVQTDIAAYSQLPRYLVELVAFGSLIILILILLHRHQGQLEAILSTLAIYAFAAYKLLPALQQIYFNLTSVKSNLAAFEAIKQDLAQAEKTQLPAQNQQAPIEVKHSIKLQSLHFTYPAKHHPALIDLNLTLPANQTIGIVGASGAGKSTLVDLLLGLIQPQQGQLLIDDQPITDHNKIYWQQSIGYVPQHIFLIEGTLAQNIAFGIDPQTIDPNRMQQAIKGAQLETLIKELPQGLDTNIGERGVLLSGGQRQRIGIARALYQPTSLLIFDEATSALDGITEKKIMQAIYQLQGQKTIILIAHRLKTVEKADQILLIEQGQITDQGTYNYLISHNPTFKKMVDHA